MNSILKRSLEFKDARFLKSHGLYPFFKSMSASEGTRVRYENGELVMTGSNNYLGLTQHPKVRAAAHQAIDRFGTGCTGSRFLNGNTVLHDQLEERMSQFLKKESTLVMTTGFLTNYTAIGTLLDEKDFILSDEENHASIVAGCKSSKAKTIVFKHSDLLDLESKIAALPESSTKLIIVDGVFSMTGEIASLKEIVALKGKYQNIAILVDDAHGLGVLGPNGAGTCEHLKVTGQVDFITGTFSKSFASLGGFISGPSIVIDYLRHKARGFIFSAALPPASVATVLAVLELLEKDPSILANLTKVMDQVKSLYRELSLPVLPSETPIQSIKIGDESTALMIVKALELAGVFATPVMFPAVPYGNALIRTSYMATHQPEDLEQVRKAWQNVQSKFGVKKNDNSIVRIEVTEQSRYNFA